MLRLLTTYLSICRNRRDFRRFVESNTKKKWNFSFDLVIAISWAIRDMILSSFWIPMYQVCATSACLRIWSTSLIPASKQPLEHQKASFQGKSGHYWVNRENEGFDRIRNPCQYGNISLGGIVPVIIFFTKSLWQGTNCDSKSSALWTIWSLHQSWYLFAIAI